MTDMSERLGALVSMFLAFVPKLVGALVILFIGYLIAKSLQKAIKAIMGKADVDKKVEDAQMPSFFRRFLGTPSKLVSALVFWVVFLGAFAIAVSVLDIAALNAFMASVFGYLPNVLAAFLILAVATAVSGAATVAVNKAMEGTPTAKVAGVAIPAITMTIATFMVLNQLLIAPEIVNIMFTALVGALALGFALAFGLGGREVASKMLQDAYDKGSAGVQQARTDAQQGKEYAQQKATEAKASTQDSEEESSQPSGRMQPAFGERIETDDRK